MSEWQPPREVATDLVYRSLFTSPEPDLRERVAELFAAWATGKNVPVDATTLLNGGSAEAESDGTRRIARGGIGAYTDRDDGRQLRAAEFRLEEHPPDGSRWTTSLRLTAEVLTITGSHVGELCGWLFDTGRRVPVIVFSPDPQMAEQQERFAKTSTVPKLREARTFPVPAVVDAADRIHVGYVGDHLPTANFR